MLDTIPWAVNQLVSAPAIVGETPTEISLSLREGPALVRFGG
ncbi:MAG TPA: hypothetical protein PKL56_01835 [Cyclobacteriaceae bacterium]|nr:hypothetical protein [Cyclobacteriaceae bacterium]HMV89145.1 hypothetical protein [Cyclobacteriaceae bacterium]HMX00020.1 hypothetical protein [Cyclobacteriaceae bacterium]HMX49118.1 hypothetical protein [Cyclobacteriaceae bacterium]HMY92840.1 hypothetical protein [Cyclobacteriaceae bacterium]